VGLSLLALLTLLSLPGLGCGERTFDPSKRPDIVLITLDTVRADHLELYGYPRSTAPNLARLGASGIVFEQALAQAPWTLPSMASIHTGLPPSIHGAVDNASPIGAEHPLLAEVLNDHGYRTQAVVSHVFVGHKFGFGRGFDAIDETHLQGHDGSSSRLLTESALALFRSASDAPSFLWVHYFDPHYSYERHEEFDFATGVSGRFGDAVEFKSPEGSELLDLSSAELRYVGDVYDEEIAHTDQWIGNLIEGVLGSGRDRPAVFLVTADHGEAFLERGRLAHGLDVYDELVWVPLVIGGDLDAALQSLKIRQAVETSSIAATILGLAGVSNHGLPGVDLIAAARSQEFPPYVYSEGSYARGSDRRMLATVHGSWKLIHHLDDDRYELYDRAVDPGETNDLSDDPASSKVKRLLMEVGAQRVSRFRTPKAPAAQAALSDAEREKLRALGYLEAAEEED
jgi:arylsulfatase A-like enzyme